MTTTTACITTIRRQSSYYGSSCRSGGMMFMMAAVATVMMMMTMSQPHHPYQANAFSTTTRPSRVVKSRPTTSFIPMTTTTTKTAASMSSDEKQAKDDSDKDNKSNLFQKIKDAGIAGSISLFLWEGAFWAISIPLAIFGYRQVTGSWPDLTDGEDWAKVGAEAFAFANVARLALPVRIGLAVSTTPWVQANIVDVFLTDKKKNEDE